MIFNTKVDAYLIIPLAPCIICASPVFSMNTEQYRSARHSTTRRSDVLTRTASGSIRLSNLSTILLHGCTDFGLQPPQFPRWGVYVFAISIFIFVRTVVDLIEILLPMSVQRAVNPSLFLRQRTSSLAMLRNPSRQMVRPSSPKVQDHWG
jgi:hypothetical protein